VSRSRYVPRRGDVIKLNFTPHAGHEQADQRPAVVLSPVEYNRRTGMAVVCPITNQDKKYPFSVAIPENDYVSGIILVDHIKSVDWRARHTSFLCSLDEIEEILAEVVGKVNALIDPENEDED
jgi:mRNA interferase MazF